MKKYYLYLYLIDDEVIYVGQTDNPWQRYKQHLYEKDNKKEYSKTNKVMLYGFDSRADVEIYETYYIATLKPKLNKSKTNYEKPLFKLEDLCFEEHSILSFEKYYKDKSKYKGTHKLREEIEEYYVFSPTQAMLIKNRHAKNDLEVRLANEINILQRKVNILNDLLYALDNKYFTKKKKYKEDLEKIENDIKTQTNMFWDDFEKRLIEMKNEEKRYIQEHKKFYNQYMDSRRKYKEILSQNDELHKEELQLNLKLKTLNREYKEINHNIKKAKEELVRLSQPAVIKHEIKYL